MAWECANKYFSVNGLTLNTAMFVKSAYCYPTPGWFPAANVWPGVNRLHKWDGIAVGTADFQVHFQPGMVGISGANSSHFSVMRCKNVSKT